MKKLKFLILIFLVILALPVSVNADMIWPSLYIVKGMYTWGIIAWGLVIEFAFVKVFTRDKILKSAFMTIVMNVVSAALGFVLIPISGIVAEVLLIPFGGGTFQLSHWIVAYLFAILSNVLIEGLILKLFFKKKFKKTFIWLFVANMISVIICISTYGFTLDSIHIS